VGGHVKRKKKLAGRWRESGEMDRYKRADHHPVSFSSAAKSIDMMFLQMCVCVRLVDGSSFLAGSLSSGESSWDIGGVVDY
jgi:hypothetical protein